MDGIGQVKINIQRLVGPWRLRFPYMGYCYDLMLRARCYTRVKPPMHQDRFLDGANVVRTMRPSRSQHKNEKNRNSAV